MTHIEGTFITWIRGRCYSSWLKWSNSSDVGPELWRLRSLPGDKSLRHQTVQRALCTAYQFGFINVIIIVMWSLKICDLECWKWYILLSSPVFSCLPLPCVHYTTMKSLVRCTQGWTFYCIRDFPLYILLDDYKCRDNFTHTFEVDL